VLAAFTWRLARLGYGEYFNTFNPLSIGSARWLTMPVAAPGHLAPLVALFLLGAPIKRRAVAPLIGDLTDGLIAGGILEEQDDKLRTPGIILIQVSGYWLFVSRPQANTFLYVGDDSLGLLWRQSIRPGGHCLDLCTGPGLQALAASGHAARVDAVEINPVAAAIARMNVAMNRLEDRVSVHFGSLFTPVHGRSYDNILANPPFIPVPDAVPYPFVGHGGRNGLRVVREILAELPEHLAPQGIAQIICALPSREGRPTEEPLDELRDWCRKTRFDLLITVTSHLPMHRGSSFFEGLVQTALAASGGDVEEIRAALEIGCYEGRSSHVSACFLQLIPGTGQMRLADLSHTKGSLWFI
jgi:hypothetical protein